MESVEVQNKARSVALVIINCDEPPCSIGPKLQNIVNKLYLMDVKMAVLVNATAQEIRQCIKKLIQMKEDELSNIICVIEAPVIRENEFKTKEGTLNVHKDILIPIFCVDGWDTKIKLIITNGLGSRVRLNPIDGEEYKPIDHGQNVAIITSNVWPDFIETFVKNLVEAKGYFEKVIAQMREKGYDITVEIAIGCKPQIEFSSS